MSKYIDDIFNATADNNRIALSLEEIAEAAYVMGNDCLSNRLKGYRKRLQVNSKTITRAVSEEINNKG